MIELTSLVGKTVFVNPDLIRSIETAPDTILCFLDGTRVPVKETPKQIQEKVIHFKQLVFQVSGKGFATWE